MSNAQEAVKTRHKETSLIFPVLALVVLFLWGSSQTLPVVIAINLLALIGILSSAFSVVRHADVLAHRLGEPYGSLILSLSVVILEVSLISALMATGDAAPTLMRDTLYSIIMKWSTKTGHRVRVFSSIDFPIRLVVTHHYIRAVLVRCNIQRYSPLLRELHR